MRNRPQPPSNKVSITYKLIGNLSLSASIHTTGLIEYESMTRSSDFLIDVHHFLNDLALEIL